MYLSKGEKNFREFETLGEKLEMASCLQHIREIMTLQKNTIKKRSSCARKLATGI